MFSLQTLICRRARSTCWSPELLRTAGSRPCWGLCRLRPGPGGGGLGAWREGHFGSVWILIFWHMLHCCSNVLNGCMMDIMAGLRYDSQHSAQKEAMSIGGEKTK